MLEKNDRRAEDRSKQKMEAVEAKPKNVLEAFEYIAELAENSNLDSDFFKIAANHIEYCVEKLGLSPIQVVLLSLFVDRSQDRQIMLSDIAEYLGCRTTKILGLTGNLDALEEKHYIRVSRNNSISYRVPIEVLKALQKNQAYVHKEVPVTDVASFFERFNAMMKEKEENEITHDALITKTTELLEQIKTTLFARTLRGFKLMDENLLMFIFMAYLFIENNDNNIGLGDIETLYDEDGLPYSCRSLLRGRHNELIRKKLIENACDDGMADPNSFKLTDYSKYQLLEELNLDSGGISEKGLISSDSLTEKHLIYNAAEAKQVAELESILSENRFGDIQARLKEAGMRTGFCCLFYGSPGTGKTETVYQLARHTGRSILQVDVAKIKSCWVGESEKNIRELFSRYRRLCDNMKLVPILLFNEADAVLGIRQEGASKAVDKMENSLQNIILQEMENLNGIMIATTNLTNNLDKAFERRFLYKVRFEKPTSEARAKIWQSMLPGLARPDAEMLANRFDLSGGEIENIARKQSVRAIITGNPAIDIPEIIESCCNERISNKTVSSKIGF